MPGRVRIHPLPSGEKIRRSSSSHKSKISQQLCHKTLIQDGGPSYSNRHDSTRRLHDINRPNRRILPHSHSPRSQKIPNVHMERPALPVPKTSLRFNFSSTSLHKSHKTYPRLPKDSRDKMLHIHRRHNHMLRFARKGPTGHSHSHARISDLGILHQHTEIQSHTLTRNYFPWPYMGLGQHANIAPYGQDRLNHPIPSETTSQSEPFGAPSSASYREDGISLPSDLTGSPSLQGPRRDKDTRTRARADVLRQDVTQPTCSGRHNMVVAQSEVSERSAYCAPSSGSCSHNRLIQDRLGRRHGPVHIGRNGEPHRVSTPHKHPGATGSLLRPTGACSPLTKDTHQNSNGQQHSYSLRQQNGGVPFVQTQPPSQANMALGNGEGHLPLGYTHTRRLQRQGRQTEQDILEQNGVEAQPLVIPEYVFQAGSADDRHVRVSPQHPTTDIRLMGSPTRRLESRRLQMSMEQHDNICLPTICTSAQNNNQDQIRQVGSASDNTALADTTMVSSSTGPGLPRTNSHTQQEGHPHLTRVPGGGTPATGENEPPCLAPFRRTFTARGLSPATTTLLFKAWRRGTSRQYQAAWNRWHAWCLQRHTDPVSAPLSQILDFLTVEFNSGKTYSTMNSYRSALSTLHDPIDGCSVGKHPLVIRLLKGIFNSKPPSPKYATTWDVAKVLSYLATLSPNRQLSLKDLTFKLVMLVALVSADRGQSLALMDTRHKSTTHGKVTFFIMNHTKTSRPGKPHKKIILPAFPQDRKLCVKLTLTEYLSRTRPLRILGNRHTLFISYTRPYKPVKSATIARWIKTVLIRAGITGYGAHSTRGAATSAAISAGLSARTILAAADWSQESTFTKFYRRPSDSSTFGRAILALNDK